MLITHWDVWVLHGLIGRPINWVPYVPIDAPLDDYTIEINIVLKAPNVRAIIAQSKFGYNEIKKIVGDDKPVYYIPHGVNTSLFKPIEDRGRVKVDFGMDKDAFVFGFVGNNDSDRKDIPGLLKAFSIFRENNKDAKDAYLIMWSGVKPAAGRAYDLVRLAKRYRIDNKVLFPVEQSPTLFYDESFMVNVYSAMDWFVTMSSGEGFGLPILEAMACGTPVIAGDHSAHHELVSSGKPQPRGILVKAKYIRPTLWTPTHQEYSFIDPYDFAEAMAKAYNEDWGKYSKNARAFAEKYDWGDIIKQWVMTLEDIELIIGSNQ